MTNNMASTLIHLRDKIIKFQGISNISCFLLEAFQFQSSEVLCVYNFTFRIIVRPLRVPKNSYLRNSGGIRAFPWLFILTTDGELKRILKCAVLSQMPSELTSLWRVSLLTRISQCGYLARGLIS